MSQFRLPSAGMASLVLCLWLSGCSYIYRVHLNGVVLRASDKSPITIGEVTLWDGTRELGMSPIGSDGTWALIGEIMNAHLQKDKNGVTWLDEEHLLLRLEMAGQRYDVPCPKAVGTKSGYDYYAFVLAAIDVPRPEDSGITPSGEWHHDSPLRGKRKPVQPSPL